MFCDAMGVARFLLLFDRQAALQIAADQKIRRSNVIGVPLNRLGVRLELSEQHVCEYSHNYRIG